MKNVCIETDKVEFIYNKIDCVPENLNSRHCHDRYEIIYVYDGSGKYTVEGVEYPVGPRTLMVFAPLSYHCVQIDAGTVYERAVIHFDKDSVTEPAKEAIEKLESASALAGAFYSPDAISDTISSVFDRFESLHSLPEKERERYARVLLSELVLLLSFSNTEFHLRDDGELGARVIKYLNQNMDKDISLDKLAKRFFVSKYYLCRAFKKHNGISVHGYINQKRVMYAKQLIESGETASGAAYRVGFGDYSAFYRAYVKIIGRSPKQAEERKANEVQHT